MTVDGAIISVLGTDNFAEYEQNVYEKYQEMAEREIMVKLNSLLSNVVFLKILKQWSAQCACRFLEYREITIRLKSGRQWEVLSPVFLRARPKKKRGRSPKRQKGALRHLGLELLGIIKRTSPALWHQTSRTLSRSTCPYISSGTVTPMPQRDSRPSESIPRIFFTIHLPELLSSNLRME